MASILKKKFLFFCLLVFCVAQEVQIQNKQHKSKEETNNEPKGGFLEKLQPQGCKNQPKKKSKELNQNGQILKKFLQP